MADLALEAAQLIVVDHSPHDHLPAARRWAIDHHTAVLIVYPPRNPAAVRGFFPKEVSRSSPQEIAEWIGVAPEAASEADTLLVLGPDRPRVDSGWGTVHVVVAKHRRGPPGRGSLMFNGAWFEDEAPELDLGI